MCIVCGKRRKLVFSTGLWHPGIHPTDDVPLERELLTQLDKLKVNKIQKSIMMGVWNLCTCDLHMGGSINL